MKTMSGLDAAFLHIETPETPMHIGALILLEKPAGHQGSFLPEIKRLLAPRLALEPFFRARLATMPLGFANPVWVDDGLPDLGYHIRHFYLSKPGTRAQLEERVAALHGTLLDRSRPLWELTVIEGLQDGSVALYFKVHHATLDGAAGIALAASLFDRSATPAAVPANWRELAERGEQTGLVPRVQSALSQTAGQYLKLVRHLPDALGVLGGVFGSLTSKGEDGMRQNLGFGPRTVFNVPISGTRHCATASLPLKSVVQLAQHFEVSFNDIVLAICSGALRQYLRDNDGIPRKPLIATVPVSLRGAGDTKATIQATLTLVNLATHIADPRKRLQAIHGAASAAVSLTRRAKSVMPTDFPSLGMPWWLGTLAKLYGASKLASKIPPIANVAISNVPGPQQPMYVAGAKITGYWPLSLVEHGLGLNITVISYADALHVGLVAADEAVPEIAPLADAIVAAFDELHQFVPVLAPPVAPRKRRSKPTVKVSPTPPTLQLSADTPPPPSDLMH